MNNKQITKNQHYVPQMYLAEFEASPKTLWVYDKSMPLDSNSNCNRRSIRSLASAPHFYDLPATLDSSNAAMFQAVEHTLGTVEGIGRNFLKATIKGLSKLKGVNFDPRHYQRPSKRLFDNLACYAAIQYLRTESSRHLVESGMQTIGRIELNDAVRTVAPDRNPNDFDFKLNDNWVKWHHIASIFNFEEFVPFFYKRIWRFGVNSTSLPLWTSDTPVVVVEGKNHEVGLAGAMCISFPLSPNVVLLMYHDKVFRDMQLLDGKPMTVPADLVEKLNAAQLRNSRRLVFSSQPFDPVHLKPATLLQH